jgi:hypothetical protein
MKILDRKELDRVTLAKRNMNDDIATDDDILIISLYDSLVETLGDKALILGDFQELYKCSPEPWTHEQKQLKTAAKRKSETTLKRYGYLKE